MHQLAKVLELSFSISPSNEYLGLISFRIDWFDLLAVQGTLKSLLQHHSLKASIFQCSAFFIVQLSHLYMTTGKTITLTVGEVMSLFFKYTNFVIAFLPRSNCLKDDGYSHQDSMVLAQRQKYRSMEQKRKPRDKSMHLWTPYL